MFIKGHESESFNGNFATAVEMTCFCLFCRHYWAFKVEPYSYMVKVGVASDSKLLEWFHNPRDTSSPRFVSPHVSMLNMQPRCKHTPFVLFTLGTPDANNLGTVIIVFESYLIL